jgi:Fic family protein
MVYESLKKLFYKNREQYEQIYQQRISCQDALFWLPLKIRDHGAFIVSSVDLLDLTAKIYNRNNKLTRIYNRLPPGIIDSYLKNSIFEEIMLTNSIEGIHSSRKELVLAMDNKKPEKILRFEGMIRKYYLLLNPEMLIPLAESKDIRTLYNEILLQEVEEATRPDGEIVRKGAASLENEFGKEIHTGTLPESALIQYMDTSLQWLNHDNSIPSIIKIAAFHYLFGYMHPFYDGNGRLSRFITSYLLKSSLNYLAPLRISYVIKNRKKEYYQAFQICNDAKSRGDLTPFVITFLSFIYEAIESLIAALLDREEKMVYYDNVMNAKLAGLSNIEKEALTILIRCNLFANMPLTIIELARNMDYSVQWVSDKIKPLIDKSLISVERDGHKYYYSANLDFIDNL